MKRYLLFVGFTVFAFFQLLWAQAVWQEDVTLRHQYVVNWDNTLVSTPTGEIITLYKNGEYGNQGLFLHKTDEVGEPVWDNDIQVTGSEYVKLFTYLVESGDGNFFVYWVQSQPGSIDALYAAKIDADGHFLWQPESVCVFEGNISSSRIMHDNTGGLYVIYGKTVEGYVTDLWCQHVSATGQLLVPGNGVELTHDTRQEDPQYLCLASDNSLIIGYRISNENIQIPGIIRMLPDYQLAWQSPFIPTTNQYSQICNLVACSDTAFIITWTENTSQNHQLFMQKFGLDGLTYYSPAINADSFIGVGNINSTLVTDADGYLYMTIHKGMNTAPSVNTVKKYNLDGVLFWGNGISLPDTVVAFYTPVPDNAGGCYFMLRHNENGGTDYFGYALQHINNSGQLMWGSCGLSIESHIPYEHYYKAVLCFTDRFHLFWVKQYSDRSGLYHQVRDTDGQLLTIPVLTITDGLAGDTSLKGIVPRANDVLIYWKDLRISDSSFNGKLYYQIVNPDGSLQLPVDGNLLADNVTGNVQLCKSLYLPNGKVVIFWLTSNDNMSHLMAQCVNIDGSIMWGDSGMVVASANGQYAITQLLAFNENNDIYLAWGADTGDNIIRTFIQKINGGQLMWGTEGILFSSEVPDLGDWERPVGFKDGYLLLKGYTINNEFEFITAAHLEPDGIVSPGWGPNGITLTSHAFDYDTSYYVDIAVLNSNLFVFYKYGTTNTGQYLYSVIEPDGEFLVTGNPLSDNNMENGNIALDVTEGIAFCFMQYNHNNPLTSIGYSKLSAPLDFPWDDTPQTVYSTPGITSDMTPKITEFEQSGYLIQWLQSSTIKAGYINVAGEYQSPQGGFDISTYCQDIFMAASMDNEVYVGWNDTEAGANSNFDTEIKLQKFANSTFVSDNDGLAVASPVLKAYPTPFNTDLTLEFVVEKQSQQNIEVFNIKGQKVITLANNVLEKGLHILNWNGRDYNGSKVATGVYYLRLTSDDTNAIKKIVVIK